MDDRPVGRTDADLEALLRDVAAEDLELLDPPDDVWAEIESAMQAADNTRDTPQDAGVVPLKPRRRAARRVVLGVAAVLILVAVALSVTLTRAEPAQVIATATLSYDPESFDPLGARARADVELRVREQKHSVAIVGASLPSPEVGADLEVWLIRPDGDGNVADLISLGVVDPADPGTLDIPADYDPATYSVVDISVEPRDGDTGHSGRSILRGPLRDT